MSLFAALSSNSLAQTPTKATSGTATSVDHDAVDRKNEARLLEANRNLPLGFEANHGQTSPRVKFFS
jgi:hypothetical protein